MQFRRHFIISEACVNNPSLKITIVMLEIMMQSDEGSIVLFCSILFIFVVVISIHF